MDITEDLIQQAIKLIDPVKKKVALYDLQKQLNIAFYESIDLRKELIKRGLVDGKETRK